MALWPDKKSGPVPGKLPEYLTYKGVPTTMEQMVKEFGAEFVSQMFKANMIPSNILNGPVPGQLGSGSAGVKKMEPDYSTNKLLELIHMRMHRERLAPGTMMTPDFSFIAPYKNGDTVVVFLVHDKKPTYIEDDWGLFPSDALITKLRLLLG